MKRQALIASLWSGGDALSRQGVQFVTLLVLARLLTPEDFGLVAMLAVFIGVAAALADGGFSVALIQRRDVDHIDESTVFWCNVTLGGALAVGLCVAAPWLADFYREPRLREITVAMSLAVVASSAVGVHAALMAKQLNFRIQALAGGIAAVTAGSVSITLALHGMGVWALVAQSVMMAVLNCLLLWWLSRWRPAFVFSRDSVRKLLGFSSYHLASTLMETAYSRLYGLLAGRQFGASALGYYANAESTRQLPGSLVGILVARTALPVFSQVQHEPLRMRRGLQFSIRVMMLLHAPMMLALIVLAEPVTELLYGRQWLPAAELLQVLALAGLLYPLHLINLHALMAGGHAKQMFRIEVAKKASGIFFLVLGASFGLMGMAWSQVAHSLLALWINTHYAGKWFGYGTIVQIRDAAPPLLAATGVFSATGYLAHRWEASSMIELTVLLAASATVYAAIMLLLRLEAGKEAWSLWATMREESGG